MLKIHDNPIFRPPPEQEQRELRQRTTLLRRVAKRQMVSALQSRNAVREIAALPGLEESLHIVARGNFPLWQIVPAVLKLAEPSTITALSIATLGFSTSNVTDLLQLMDVGSIGTVAIVASVYFERQNPAEYRLMAEGLEARGQRLVALRSHAKVITLALSDGRRFAVESSANLRSNRNLEFITITQSPDLHDFHAGWINEVIGVAGTRGHR